MYRERQYMKSKTTKSSSSFEINLEALIVIETFPYVSLLLVSHFQFSYMYVSILVFISLK